MTSMSWPMRFRPTDTAAPLVLAIVLLWANDVAGAPPEDAPAPPDSADDGRKIEPAAVERARALADAANEHYAAGRYRLAVPLLREAYELTARPALLFNLAQSHRRAGDCAQALDSYRQYLARGHDPQLRRKAELLVIRLAPDCPAGET